MKVYKIARDLGGEIILAVVDRDDKLIPVCRDEAAVGLTVVALLQLMSISPAFAEDREAIERFLVEFGVGRFKEVDVVRVGGPKE